jgi:hypothetical protein
MKKVTKEINHPTEIYEFIKEKRLGHRQKVGVFVGKNSCGYIKIGWSRANLKKDKFDKEVGLSIARGRTLAKTPTMLPSSLLKRGEKFVNRCNRFFKVPVSRFTLECLFPSRFPSKIKV